jgi:hypothetical protein
MKGLALMASFALWACTYPALGDADCPVELSYSSFLAAGQSAVNLGSGGSAYSQALQWQGNLSASPQIEVIVTIYGGGGNSSTPDWPSMLGPNSAVPVVGRTSPDAYVNLFATNPTVSGSDVDFSGVEGTLDVTSADDQTLAATLSNITFLQGTFDTSGNFTATPGGCTSTLTASFSTTVETN